MVSQFISSHNVRLLGDLDFDFPEGTHAIGRLDNHSEGLLLLTTNKKVTRLLFHPEKKHQRSYAVMVNNVVNDELLQRLKTGVTITVKDGQDYLAVPTAVELIANIRTICPHIEDTRQQYPHSWLLITLTEGKFHQVRKMVQAINRRCQRLVRVSIGNLKLGDLEPGAVKEMQEKEFFELIGIEYKA